MKIKGLQEEDFVNYKKASMFIGLGTCNWKCCAEGGFDKSICQNTSLAHAEEIEVTNDSIYKRYINNPITNAIVIGGLEPFTMFEDVYELISFFRSCGCNDDFVIYTGYYPHEIQNEISRLSELSNIIVKFGRFKIDSDKKYDDILGVNLASDNQYAEVIS